MTVINPLESWFLMGGYAGFVWPAYSVAAIVLGGLAFLSWRRHWRSADLLARLQGRLGTRE